MKTNKALHTLALFPFLIWVAFLIVIPLLLIVYFAFTKTGGGFSLDNFRDFFQPDYMRVLWRSLYLAVLSTIICFLVGYPVAAIIAGNTFRKKTLLIVLLIAPMWMNFLLRTYAWLTLLEGNGVFNTILETLSLPKQAFLGNSGAIVFGMVYNFLPYMIFPIYTAITKIPDNVIEAAKDLGGNGRMCFFKIILPLSTPGIVSGVTMVFVPGVTTFVISQFLGSGKITLIGDIIEEQFMHSGNWGFGAAISLIVMVVVVLCMWLVNRFSDETGVMLP